VLPERKVATLELARLVFPALLAQWQGRGIFFHRDPACPCLVVFSCLGMGATYFDGRVVSAADREGSAIVARAKTFRAAEFLQDLNAGWNGRTDVVSGGAPSAPVLH
jgi:hypothetical protein